MTPEVAREWVGIVRDLSILAACLAILVWQGIFAGDPNALVLGAVGTLLAAPAVYRLEQTYRKSGNQRDGKK